MNNKMVISIKIMTASIVLALLAGCMYPKTDTSSGAIVSKEAVRNVQGAIDQYLTTTGVLPIHNSDASDDRYEKFRVDFAKLKDGGYMENIPNSAFEAGGNFYFLVLNETEEPIIKAQSILIMQKVIDVQKAVTEYISSHDGNIPAGEEASKGFYYVDFDKLDIKKPTINSLYTGSTSALLVTDNGSVYVDYAPDIMQLLQKNNQLVVSENYDLRELLVANSDYVPVKSAAYRLVNGEPVPFE